MFELTPFRRNNNDIAKNDEYFNQLFRSFFGDNFSSLIDMTQNPFKVDIRETDNAYLVEAELPGIEKESINVEYDNSYLTISAKRDDKTEKVTNNFVRHERHFGELKRSFYVDDIDEDKIEASFQQGILRLVLPKQAGQAKKKRIDIH